MLAAALPATTPPLSYWGLVVVTGVLVIVVAALLVALVPWLRRSGARDKALDQLLALGPDLADLIKDFKGDPTTVPPIKGFGYQIPTQGRRIDFLASKVEMSDADRRAYRAIGGSH